MFPKLVAVILGVGVIGCGLLALRQQRLEAASDLARVQVHLRAQDERLLQLRTEIARRVSPEHVREMAVAIGPLRPLVPVLPADGRTIDVRRASTEPSGPVVEDAPPLPRTPGSPLRAAVSPAKPKPAVKTPPKYAKVETER